MPPKKLKTSAEDHEVVAKEWIQVTSQLKALEKRKAELKEFLEPYLDSQPGKTSEIVGFKFTLVVGERESFRLKDAKEKIDGRVLAPYITVSAYSQIRSTFQGPDETA